MRPQRVFADKINSVLGHVGNLREFKYIPEDRMILKRLGQCGLNKWLKFERLAHLNANLAKLVIKLLPL